MDFEKLNKMKIEDKISNGLFKTKYKESKSTYNNEMMNVGDYVDEMEMTVTIKTEDDVDNLIKFLNHSRPCFHRNGT